MEWKYLEIAIHPKYLTHLKKLSDQGSGFIDPSTPAFLDMLTPSRFMAQGTFLCLKNVLDKNYPAAMNVAGGFHHATPTQSMGGCVINDMGIAIQKLRMIGYAEKIAILDFDYHPHNGTVAYFGDDPSILKASVHESGWFDYDDNEIGWGKGINSVINRGLSKSISGQEYLQIVEELLRIVRKFQPDLVVMLNGVDPHIDDPVVKRYISRVLALTDTDFQRLTEMVCDFVVKNCDNNIVILGAGGYSAEITSRIWFQTLNIAIEKILR